MTSHQLANSRDWVRSNTAYAIAWGLPHVAIIAAAFLDPMLRTAVWSVAAAWMGAACILNAARCGRTHCRYTGPYYLVLVIPIVVFGFGFLSGPDFVWWILLAALLLGGKVIWLVTEKIWGRYQTEQ